MNNPIIYTTITFLYIIKRIHININRYNIHLSFVLTGNVFNFKVMFYEIGILYFLKTNVKCYQLKIMNAYLYIHKAIIKYLSGKIIK